MSHHFKLKYSQNYWTLNTSRRYYLFPQPKELASYQCKKPRGGGFGFLSIQTEGDMSMLVWTTLHKIPKLGLERWLSGLEHLLLLQRKLMRFLAPSWWATTICSFHSRGSNSLFWPLQLPGTRMQCTYIPNTLTHTINTSFCFRLQQLPCAADFTVCIVSMANTEVWSLKARGT